MRRLLLTISLIAFFIGCKGQPSISHDKPASIKELHWLEGNWKRVNDRPQRSTYENWKNTDVHSMSGKGTSITNGDTTFVENLSIISKDGKLYYVAEVDHNESAVHFKIQITGKTSFVSSNAQHDFPKQIAYRLKDGQLIATISGNGESIDFVFDKVEP